MSQTENINNPTKAEIAIASAILVLIGLIAVGAWFAKSDTLLGSLIQAGLAWCF